LVERNPFQNQAKLESVQRRLRERTTLSDEGGWRLIRCADTYLGEQDPYWKGPARFYINPPPKEGRCNLCGRHVSELKPFGGPGDPCVGDFSGALLVKRFRSEGPPLTAEEIAAHETYDEEWEEHGPANAANSFGPSWECRDCIVLNDTEYWEVRLQDKGSTSSGLNTSKRD
jgi:hypothetical protein